jgi:cold shock CspA family protein
MDDLRDLLADDGSVNQDIDEAVRQVERVLERGRQQFPDEPRLASAEADFARLLRDDERSLAALKAAFASNPRDPYVATRLARVYEDRNDLASAEECLRRSLQTNGADKQLHFRYAQVLRAIDPTDAERLAYHFKRAFTSGDNNHEAQFWYARYAFESDDTEKRREAKTIFRRLRSVPMGHGARIRVRDRMSNGALIPSRFTGTVSRVEVAHGFVSADGRGDEIFLHASNVDGESWDDLRRGDRVAFHIGFNFGGPLALEVHAI